ncbi:hypothetical protein BFP78_02585 [Gaetbulibacter sp. 5U11]|nr:hypothetical protein BFP78_02585 [Gaetbulibacter sp. 5U11]
MKFKTYFICFLILFFRGLDLYTTHIATTVNFKLQELNILVQKFGFDKQSFFISECIFAIILVLLYLLSQRKIIHYRKAKTFSEFNYINFRTTFNSLKKLLFLFFEIIPVLYITNSIILSLNNYLVYLYHENYKKAIDLYTFLDKNGVLDFFIYKNPIILLIFFMGIQIHSKFKQSLKAS